MVSTDAFRRVAGNSASTGFVTYGGETQTVWVALLRVGDQSDILGVRVEFAAGADE